MTQHKISIAALSIALAGVVMILLNLIFGWGKPLIWLPFSVALIVLGIWNWYLWHKAKRRWPHTR